MKVRETHSRGYEKPKGRRMKMTVYTESTNPEELESLFRDIALLMQKRSHRVKKHGGRMEYKIVIKE
jgi:hypothetical protein